MKIAARLERFEQHERRSKRRRRLRLGTNIKSTGENVSIHDISSTGMLIETGVRLKPLDALEVDLPENGPTEALVMWSSGRFFGCEFKQPLSKAAISAAFLRSMPEDSRQVSPKPTDQPSRAAATEADEEDALSSDDVPGEDRLPLRVRAIAIVASAILLWALIIWAAEAGMRLVGASFG